MSRSGIISRVASLLVVACYIAMIASGKVPRNFERGMIGVFFGLPLLWFPEFFGTLMGYFGHAPIYTESPPVLVAFMGWVFLLAVPAIIAALSQ